MANEIYKLKIGSVEYPIYSEGVKVLSTTNSSTYPLVFASAVGSTSGVNNKLYTDSNAAHCGYNPSTNTLQVDGVTISMISAPTTAGGGTKGFGTAGQILKSNGGTVYWGEACLPLSGGTVNGSVTITNSITAQAFYQSSDERLKTFGDKLTVDLDKLSKLRKSYFKYNGSDVMQIGVSAQEVQKVYPELVNTDNDGMLSVAYDKLSVVALTAIDEVVEEIKDLKVENTNLKEEIKDLKNDMEILKAKLEKLINA